MVTFPKSGEKEGRATAGRAVQSRVRRLAPGERIGELRRTPRMQKFLRLEFVPTSVDFGLLVLRVWFGAAMAALHGWGKMAALVSGKNMFSNAIIGIPPWPAFILTTFAEFVCAILLVIGLWTRMAALFLIVTMAVAFFVAHGGALSGPSSGEMAFVYLAAYTTILIAGAGRFSVDRK